MYSVKLHIKGQDTHVCRTVGTVDFLFPFKVNLCITMKGPFFLIEGQDGVLVSAQNQSCKI